MKQSPEDTLHGKEPMTGMNIKTLSSHLADHLDYQKALNYSEHTSDTVRRNNRRLLMWLEERHQVETADQLRKEHFENWQKHLAAWQTHKGTPLKAKSINRCIDTARGFLKYLAYHGFITATLVDALRYVKELLGHETLATLKHYARLTILDLKKTHEKCHPREREAQI